MSGAEKMGCDFRKFQTVNDGEIKFKFYWDKSVRECYSSLHIDIGDEKYYFSIAEVNEFLDSIEEIIMIRKAFNAGKEHGRK